MPAITASEQRQSAEEVHLRELNPAQREGVTWGVDRMERGNLPPPLLIIAGAGTGKTKTLAHRVAQLILNGAHPGRMLLLTFGRRMAAEMIRRAEHICAATARSRAFPSIEWAGTFHAVGATLLRLHAESIGLSPAFTIMDRSDAADVMDVVRDELALSRTRNRFPRKATCLAIYSFVVNNRISVEAALKTAFPWCAEWEEELHELFGAYVEAKQVQNVLDYDDLLLYWAKMMESEAIAQSVAARFDHVLVDEYQDTNALQASILLALKPDGRGLTVVGDDAQSIYAFRAARIKNILEFPSHFDPPAQVVTLEQNYRSTQPILDACNRIIAQGQARYAKNLYASRKAGGKPVLASVDDEAAQVEFVVDRVLANRERGMELKDQAVLFRAAHHSAALEVELTRRNIPFVKFGGLKFLEAAHIKDVLAVLRWTENVQDKSAGFRVLKLLPGFGPATASRALELIELGGGLEALGQFKPPAAAKDVWAELVQLLDQISTEPKWPGQIDRIRRWYDPLLESAYDLAHLRLADLDQLGNMAAHHPSRSSFLTQLALDPPDAVGAEAGPPLKDEDWLVLSTIHSAKGQEWRAVSILNVVDGCIPSDLATGSAEEIDEERRLLYVAMTRAKDDLVLVQPRRFFVRGQSLGGDRHIYAPRSRFIADGDLELFELTGHTSRAMPGMAAASRQAVVGLDLKASMKQMWKRS